MKSLLLMRHGKSDWDHPDLEDHDRPLAPRGERDAPRMGAVIAALGIMPDIILSSTAVRARETARLVIEAMGYGVTLTEIADIYAASGDTLLMVLSAQASNHESVLLVGHNPGIEELVGMLIAGLGRAIGVRMPTAALACLTFDRDDWRDVAPGGGTLQWLLTPRTIAPLLDRAKRR